VVLKLSEGVFEFVMKMVTRDVLSAVVNERLAVQQAIQALVQRYDYSEFGGAPLLGIDGICIICHGSSGDRAIRNAIGVAARYARARLNERIVQELNVQPTLGGAEETVPG
ncbi:MAG TPA: phosphate acyltransferase PlsX, partial [Gemmataceae bacterium]